MADLQLGTEEHRSAECQGYEDTRSETCPGVVSFCFKLTAILSLDLQSSVLRQLLLHLEPKVCIVVKSPCNPLTSKYQSLQILEPGFHDLDADAIETSQVVPISLHAINIGLHELQSVSDFQATMLSGLTCWVARSDANSAEQY